MGFCTVCGRESDRFYCNECNNDKFSNFDNETKQAFFNEIAENYFNKNFGTMLKSDFETLIFSYFIENIIEKGQNFDDYTLSKQLGISESRIRVLKERKELKYPYKKYDWKKAFSDLIPNAYYNKKSDLVQLKIEDVNVLKDLRHFIYSKNYFDVYQLNPKLFQCKLEFFIQICMDIDSEFKLTDEAIEHIKSLNLDENEISAVEKIFNGNYKEGIKQLLFDASQSIFEEIAKKLPLGELGKKIILDIFDVIKKEKYYEKI